MKSFVNVNLSDIQAVSKSDLIQNRLDMLLNGFSPFDEVLKSSSDPITLSRGNGIPYTIIDGRHRIYLARQKGYKSIKVFFL